MLVNCAEACGGFIQTVSVWVSAALAPGVNSQALDIGRDL